MAKNHCEMGGTISMSNILESFETELIDDMEDILDDFFSDLVTSGLKIPTAERHTANVDLFLIQYHAFHFLQGIDAVTPERVYDFLGVWYFQRVFSPRRSDMSSILGSLKRFFNFLHQENQISNEQWNRLKPALNDKTYFQERYLEYETNPPEQEDEDDLSDEDMCELVNSVLNLSPSDEEDDDFDDDHDGENSLASLKDVLNHLKELVEPGGRQDNVISLESRLQSPQKPDLPLPAGQKQPPQTIESLREYCLAMHRANLIFIRWLDRYRCHPTDLPPEAFGLCASCDSMLEFLLPILEEEQGTEEEIEKAHELLDIMDRMLWAARHHITQVLGLDLRLLPL